MTQVNFLVHRLLVSETQTDRQDTFIIDIYIYIYGHFENDTIINNIVHNV